jgi:sugar lactone lactonase YvrE
LKSLLAVIILSLQWGWGQATPLKVPVALDKLPSGDLFALTQTGGVHRFHQDGGLLKEIGSFQLPREQNPIDIVSAVVNHQPCLLISSAYIAGGYVFKYSLDGKVIQKWKAWHVLSGIDFDPSSDLFYAAGAESAEVYYGSANSQSSELQSLGSVLGAGELGPLIVDSRRSQLLIGDIQNGQVFSFDLRNHRSKLVLKGLGSPEALLLSSDGDALYVADGVKRRVLRVDLRNPDTKPVVFSAEDVYKDPDGLALMSGGYFAVADDRANAIFIVSPDGKVGH